MSNLRVDELESLTTGRTVSVDEIDTGLREDLANPDKGARLVRGAVIYINTIADLLATDTATLADRQQVNLSENGYLYVWEADKSKAQANGVTLLDPSVSLEQQGDGVGDGCFVLAELTPDIARLGITDFYSQAKYIPDLSVSSGSNISTSNTSVSGKTIFGRSRFSTQRQNASLLNDSADSSFEDATSLIGNFYGPMPEPTVNNFAAVSLASSEAPIIAFGRFQGCSTSIRLGWRDRSADGLPNQQVKHGMIFGNAIKNDNSDDVSFGIENLRSSNSLIVGNAIYRDDGVAQGAHGLRLTGTESLGLPNKGTIAVANSIQDRKHSGVSIQSGVSDFILNSLYINNIEKEAIRTDLSVGDSPDFNAILANIRVSNTRSSSSAVKTNGMDGVFLSGIITDVTGGLTSGSSVNKSHRNDVIVRNASARAASLYGSNNITTLIMDGTKECVVDCNNSIVIVTGENITTTTAMVYVAGNNNTVILCMDDSSNSSLRVTGQGNTVMGSVAGNVDVRGSNNAFTISVVGSFLCYAGADGNAIYGNIAGDLRFFGANNNQVFAVVGGTTTTDSSATGNVKTTMETI